MMVIEHLECHCGPIVEGWTSDADGNDAPFQIVKMRGGPIDGSIAFSTLGLSNIPLRSPAPKSSKLIRHELVMLARHEVPANLPAVLQQVAAEAIGNGLAYLRGDVLGPRGLLFHGTTLEALYVSMPVYFGDAFASVRTEKLGEVIFAWLIPITRSEANYVVSNGWDRFEEKLEH
jgi:hypothetical protein